jgi:hypothetical protein
LIAQLIIPERKKRRRCRLRLLQCQRLPRPPPCQRPPPYDRFDDEFEDRFEEEFEDLFEDEFEDEFEDLFDEEFDELFEELFPATCHRSPC